MNDGETLAPLPAGTRVHELVIQQPLGRGGAGIVYAAIHDILGETLAVKEFLPAQLARRGQNQQVEPQPGQEEVFAALKQKFLQEGKTLVELARPRPHPNIVQATDAFRANETVYLCMRFERGEALDAIIRHSGPLTQARLREWLPPLLDGLEHAHRQGVLHRDIKPSNILIREDGSPVLIDFGAAHRQRPGGPVSVVAQYTPDFAAPEQFLSGEQGPWTDLYCLAATFVYCLTGQAPRGLHARLEPTGPLADVDPVLLAALTGALQFEHDKRPQSVAQWREQFGLDQGAITIPAAVTTAAADDAPTLVTSRPDAGTAQPVGPNDVTLSQPSASSRWLLFAMLILLALVGLGGALWFTLIPSESRVQAPDIQIPPVPSVALEPTAPEPPNPLAVLERLAAGLDCARLSGEVERTHDQTRLRLRGFVRDQRAWAGLTESLAAALPEVEIRADDVAQAAPFCAWIARLEATVSATPVHQGRPVITFNHPDRHYHQEDFIALTAIQPGAAAGFLYVDFIDRHGEHALLLPNPAQSANFLTPGGRVQVGVQTAEACAAKPDACFLASRPHGNNLVLTIWSARPLPPNWRDLAELQTLLQHESTVEGGALNLGYQFITTAP
jgi:serine/threonine protein kinase